MHRVWSDAYDAPSYEHDVEEAMPHTFPTHVSPARQATGSDQWREPPTLVQVVSALFSHSVAPSVVQVFPGTQAFVGGAT